MIDNITYNDLDLDEIYVKLNSCTTTSGEDFIYKRLFSPFDNNREDFIYLINNVNEFNADKALKNVGKIKKYSFNESLLKLLNANQSSNFIHYLSGLIVILSFLLIFVTPGPGLLCFFAAIAFSLYLYFNEQKIKSYELYAYSYISKMAKEFKNIYGNNDPVVSNLLKEGNEIREKLKPLVSFSFLIKTNPGTDGNPVDVVLDYIRMIFHVDLIKYNNVLKCIKNNESQIKRLYEIFGMFDSAKSIRNYRDSLAFYSVPEFVSDKQLEIIDLYHPLIENPVLNSINSNTGILVTGSNASGKSTFLKAVALCIVFAESFGFSFSKKIVLKKCSVYSSMALRDSITSGESYFIKEIKALKRIIDATKDEDFVICFIDEVLRGTNTIERIAAAKEILDNLENDKTLVFAATHDIELASLLNHKYENYHFSEEFNDKDVLFSYKLCQGEATSRNAIKLLSLIGYDENTVINAEKLVENYTKTGIWKQS